MAYESHVSENADHITQPLLGSDLDAQQEAFAQVAVIGPLIVMNDLSILEADMTKDAQAIMHAGVMAIAIGVLTVAGVIVTLTTHFPIAPALTIHERIIQICAPIPSLIAMYLSFSEYATMRKQIRSIRQRRNMLRQHFMQNTQTTQREQVFSELLAG